MSDVVFDVSAALACLLTSQSTGASEAFVKAYGEYALVAPYVFAWELNNVLVRLERRGAISAATYAQALANLQLLDVDVQSAPQGDEVATLAQQARAVGLSLFDAAYLQLAVARQCPLASRDDQLLEVAAKHVVCIDLRGGDLP